MREIKFRGMTVMGVWHYGLLCHTEGKWYISNHAGSPKAFEIRPETRSEYTGLKDRTGREIYEGDLVKIPFHGVREVGYKYGAFTVQIDEVDMHQMLGDYDESCEVIGNIHENPELLER